LYRPLGFQDELRVIFTCGGELWGAMDLVRGRGRPDFSPEEVSLMRRVAPHVGAGLKAGVLREQKPLHEGETGVPGVIVLDRKGKVSQYTAAAKYWLEELEETDADGQEGRGPAAWREGKGLPAAVRNLLGFMGQALSNAERDKEIIPRVRVRTRTGRWLTLQASQSETNPNGNWETVIVLEPPGPKDMLWLNAATYDITPREREVIVLVVRGLSTRQIAENLFISQYTVQEHLCNVFDKVGVRSRQALVERLFFDNIYPTIFA
jgi:DNA-binding CsgD family transcriptional regulator